jgi:DNA-binding transcriptional LysR family regulator
MKGINDKRLGYLYQAVSRQPICVVVSPQHALAQRQQAVALEELLNYPVARRIWSPAWDASSQQA